MRIIIVGAGLGGLTAAFCFSRKGHEVTVLEQHSTFAALGAGLAVRPGASRVLHSWGLRPDLAKICDPTTSFILRDVQTGEVIMRNIMTEVSTEIDWSTTRKAIMELLYRKAREAGVTVQFGVAVQDVDEDDVHATVTAKNGRRFVGDLILAADGIRSTIRHRILADTGANIDPVAAPATLYGIDAVPLPQLEARGDAKRLQETDFSYVWQGKDCFVVSRSRVSEGNFTGTFGIKGDNDMKKFWEEDGDITYVRDFFRSAGACSDLMAALEEATRCDRWKVVELPDLPRWYSKHGRIALLGDSAHGMHSTAAMGYSLIVEEIGVMEFLLDRSTDPAKDVPIILETWQDICKPRAERVKAYARSNTGVFLGASAHHRVKSADVQTQIKSFKNIVPDMHAKFTNSSFVKWCYDYDAVSKAEEYLSSDKARL